MFCLLPDDLQFLILDFVGCPSCRKHRRHRFILVELNAFFLMSRHMGRRACTPSFIARLQGFKKCLELAYCKAEANHTKIGIP